MLADGLSPSKLFSLVSLDQTFEELRYYLYAFAYLNAITQTALVSLPVDSAYEALQRDRRGRD
jgi:hypothetical protein